MTRTLQAKSPTEPSTGSRIVRAVIKASNVLAPGGNCTATLLFYDTTAGEWVDLGVDVTVEDYNHQNYILAGEEFVAQYVAGATTSRLEPVGSYGLLRKSKNDGEISAGGSGTVSIWHNTGGAAVDSTKNVTAHFTWGDGSSPIDIGSEIWVKYEDGRWVVVHGEAGPGEAGPGGDTVQIVEITHSDGTIFTNHYSEAQTTALDCIFRGRKFVRATSGNDLCDRTDVTDQPDIWIKLDHNPWGNTPNPDFIEMGTRVLARKTGSTFTQGENEFDLWEGVHWESKIWGLDPVGDWDGATLVSNVYTNDGVTDTDRNTAIPTPFKYPLWDNVLNNPTSNAKGICIQIGRDYFPLVMARRAVDYQANMNVNQSVGETGLALNTVGVASEAPFNDVDSPPATASNPFRKQCLAETEVHVERDANQTADYKVTNVARSEPILIEVVGTDGDGIATELDGTTKLSVWDARVVQPDPATPGTLNDGGGNTVNEETVWLAFSGISKGSNGNLDPYYLDGGQKFLAYDQGQDFTPTGGSARRLYMAVRDSMTHWGKALENWTNAGGIVVDSVMVNPCSNADGDNTATGQEHKVHLPAVGPAHDPNVVEGQVIAYRLTAGGGWVCVSDYQDERIGRVMLWAGTSGLFGAGWALMDGTANSAGSGIDMSSELTALEFIERMDNSV